MLANRRATLTSRLRFRKKGLPERMSATSGAGRSCERSRAAYAQRRLSAWCPGTVSLLASAVRAGYDRALEEKPLQFGIDVMAPLTLVDNPPGGILWTEA